MAIATLKRWGLYFSGKQAANNAPATQEESDESDDPDEAINPVDYIDKFWEYADALKKLPNKMQLLEEFLVFRGQSRDAEIEAEAKGKT